jgi:glycosyltransferase involved in cell wall biosynthesis
MSPPVSLIGTVLNEAAGIEGWLDSLLRQSRPPDQIVLVDGGSDDGTVEAIERARAADARIEVHRAPGATIAQGRNIAIDRARGPIIAVTDAGTELEADWLERLVAPLENGAGVGVASGFFLPAGDSFFERTLATVITPQLTEIEPEKFLPSSRSVAFLKEWWQRVGGYPEWLEHCEDLVFDMDLRDAGARFEFVPDARVTWRARPSLRRFFRQYYLYARGDGHALLWGRRHAVRYASYALGAGLLAAGTRHPAARVALGAGFVAYMQKFWRRVLRMPPADGPPLAAALALVPVIVVTGDVAKMIGYPVGRLERARAGGAEGLRPGGTT